MNRRHSSRSKEEALLKAAETGDYHAVYSLLANGVNKNVVNQEGRTALYVSTERGKVDVVRLLVNAGADPLIKDKEGNVAVERLKMTTMSEAVKSRIYACLTNTKLGQQAMDQSVPNPSFSIAELSPDQVVENFTRTLSQVTAPFLRALCGRSEAAGTIRVAPVFASDPVMIQNDGPAVPVTATPVSVPAATTHIAPTVSSDATALDNSKTLPLDAVITHTPPVSGVSSAASPVPLNNWLTPVLRLKGMSDEHIIEEVCHLVIGTLEYTEEGFSSMSDDNFDKVFAHHFTVPGRLATLRCAQRYIRRAYNEFEDRMRGLTVHTNTTEAPRLSTVGLDSQGERQAPSAVVTSTQQDVTHVANAARNSSVTTAATLLSPAPGPAPAPAPGPGPVSAALSVDCTSPALKRHVCPLDCKCSCAAAVVLAGRKHSRDITPVKGTSGPQAPSPLTNTFSPPSAKRRYFSPSRRAVILPEPGGNYTGAVLAILMEKRASRTVQAQP